MLLDLGIPGIKQSARHRETLKCLENGWKEGKRESEKEEKRGRGLQNRGSG